MCCYVTHRGLWRHGQIVLFSWGNGLPQQSVMSPAAPGRAASMTGAGKLVLSWGSAVGGSAADSEIFAGDRGRLALFVPSHMVVIMAPVRPGRG